MLNPPGLSGEPRFVRRPTMPIRLSALAYFTKRALPIPEVAPIIRIFIL